MKKVILILILSSISLLSWGQTELFDFHKEDSQIHNFKQGKAPIAHFPFEYLFKILGKDLGPLNKTIAWRPIYDGPDDNLPSFRGHFEHTFLYNSNGDLEQIESDTSRNGLKKPHSITNYTYTNNSVSELLSIYEDNEMYIPYTLNEYSSLDSNLDQVDKFIVGVNENIPIGYDNYSFFDQSIVKGSIEFIDGNDIRNDRTFMFEGNNFLSLKWDSYPDTPMEDGTYYSTDGDEIKIKGKNFEQIVEINDDGFPSLITYYYKTNQGELVEEEKLSFAYYVFPPPLNSSVFVYILNPKLAQPIIEKHTYYFDVSFTVSSESIAQNISCKLPNPIQKDMNLQCLELADANINFYNELGQLLGNTQADNFGNFNINNIQQSGFLFLSALTTEGHLYHDKLILID